jgi:hypothetical protein
VSRGAIAAAVFVLVVPLGCRELAALGDAPAVTSPDAAQSDGHAACDATTGGSTDVDGDSGADGDPDGDADTGPSSDSPPDVPDASPAPPSSCLDVLRRDQSRTGAPSGRYSIAADGTTFDVHCDMNLMGGGWTAFFVGRLGRAFSHFDYPGDDCVNPEVQCLRHVPSTVTIDTPFAAMCGSDALGFSITAPVLDYLRHGLSNGWKPLSGARALAGSPNVAYGAMLYTGNGTDNTGWILSANDNAPLVTPHTFANSYDTYANTWDYCNGVDYNEAGADAGMPMVYLFYR